jgi:hypothetical protein
VSALTAALAASVRAPHASAAAAAGHTVWIDEEPHGYAVRCIPHGDLGAHSAHLVAFCAAVRHDMEMGGQGE